MEPERRLGVDGPEDDGGGQVYIGGIKQEQKALEDCGRRPVSQEG